MKILGIDPGSIHCGYGLIQSVNSRITKTNKYISSGRISLPAGAPLHARLKDLYLSLREMIEEYNPDEIVVERIFFAKGTKAALSLGHARGVVLLAASLTDLPLYEYSALEVKKAVVGYGRADKNQVQKMVAQILGIKHALSPDSADALALALCHANSKEIKMLSGR